MILKAIKNTLYSIGISALAILVITYSFNMTWNDEAVADMIFVGLVCAPAIFTLNYAAIARGRRKIKIRPTSLTVDEKINSENVSSSRDDLAQVVELPAQRAQHKLSHSNNRR